MLITVAGPRPKREHVLVVALVLLLFSGACSSGSPRGTGSNDGGTTTITWYAGSIDQHQNDYRQSLVEAFELDNPSIRVNIDYGPVDTDANRERLRGKLNGKDGPDVYAGDVVWVAEFAHAGLARRVDDLFAPGFWERFDPDLLPAARYQGKTYAVPLFQDQGMLFYRKDLVRTPPPTWEQLEDIAAGLVTSKQVAYGYLWQGAAFEGLTCIWTELLADAGGSTIDPATRHATMDTPAGQRALRFLQSLVQKKITPAQVTEYQEPDATQLFVSGRAAFLRGWNPVLPRMDSLSGKVGVAPLPTFAGQRGPGFSTTGGWDLYVNPKIPRSHRDAVTTFLRWMTDAPAQRILLNLSQIPTTRQVREDVKAEPPMERHQAVVAGLGAPTVPRPAEWPTYPRISKAVYTAVNAALRPGADVETRLRTADRQIDEAIR
jgi:multiple sugar transport system substrate-binding protein